MEKRKLSITFPSNPRELKAIRSVQIALTDQEKSNSSFPKPETNLSNLLEGQLYIGDETPKQYIKDANITALLSGMHSESVFYSLHKKQPLDTNSHTAHTPSTQSSLETRDGEVVDDCKFEGKMTSFNKIYDDKVDTFIAEEQKPESVLVNTSLSMQSAIRAECFWSWPWVDSNPNAVEWFTLSLGLNDMAKSPPLPQIPCDLPVYIFKQYLESVQPFLSPAQFRSTEKRVQKFAVAASRVIYERMNMYSNAADGGNWVTGCVPDHDYAESTKEAPVLNVGIIAPFCHDVWPEQADSLMERAVIIIRLAVEFWTLVRHQTLNPFLGHAGKEVDMEQFLYLFSSSVTRGAKKATKVTFMKKRSEGDAPRYIIVAYRGNLFTMNVVDEDYRYIALTDLVSTLKGMQLFTDSCIKQNMNGRSLLTAGRMTGWSSAKERLIELSDNGDYIAQIDSAMFLLSLDHMNVSSMDQVANESMFGDACNRWYDKGLNFYIHNNGYVTVNINSRILDIATVAPLLTYMHLRILQEEQVWEDDLLDNPDAYQSHSTKDLPQSEPTDCPIRVGIGILSKQNLQAVTRLSLVNTEARYIDFEINDEIFRQLYHVAHTYSDLCRSILTSTCKVSTCSKHFFADTGVDKDALAHLAIHLAFYRMYYRSGSVGTKLSMKTFANMRYDILRSTTKQMIEWCQAFLDIGSIESDKKESLFWAAHNKHVALRQDCLGGKGIDNYLRAMQHLSKDLSLAPEEDMFEDEAFSRSGGGGQYEILVESMGAGCTSCPVFAPSLPSGYGVGYAVADSFLFFTVTSFQSEKVACAPLFASMLKRSSEEIVAFFT